MINSFGEKGPAIKGMTFDGTNNYSESVDAVIDTLVRITGASGYKYTETTNRKPFILWFALIRVPKCFLNSV